MSFFSKWQQRPFLEPRSPSSLRPMQPGARKLHGRPSIGGPFLSAHRASPAFTNTAHTRSLPALLVPSARSSVSCLWCLHPIRAPFPPNPWDDLQLPNSLFQTFLGGNLIFRNNHPQRDSFHCPGLLQLKGLFVLVMNLNVLVSSLSF